MVTFNNAGRLGNFLFQAAVCVGYAAKHGLEFSFPKDTKHPIHCPVYYTEYHNPNYNSSLAEVRLWEGRHSYEELPFKNEWQNYNIIIEGYRQTKKYWEHCEDLIKNLFHPNWELNDVVGVHVRRGDYLVLTSKHPYISEQWYENAMSKFLNHNFVFYSDDIKWCIEKFGHRSDCSFSQGNDELTDLLSLANCRHQINSSSTFSLWGALLGRNEDKIVYTPEHWFVPGWDGLDVSDIVPENFIKL